MTNAKLKMKRIVIKRSVVCKSGLKGWQDRLQRVYKDFDDFEFCCNAYGLHERLGFKTATAAWDANPIVRGSTNPNDYEKVKPANYNKPSRRG